MGGGCLVIWKMVGNVFDVVGVVYNVVCVVVRSDGCYVVLWW